MRIFILAAVILTPLLLTAKVQASATSSAKTAKAVEAMESGDPKAAQKLLEEALRIDPNDSDAHYQLGRIALQQGNYAAAISSLEKARAAGYPDSLALGIAYFESRRWKEAETAFRAAEKAQPKNREPGYFLGLNYLRQERYAEAEKTLAPSTQDSALAGRALYHRAFALEKAGRKAEAITLLTDLASRNEDPMAAQARTALNRLNGKQPWRINLGLMHQTDSNVILAPSGTNVQSAYTPEEVSRRAGNRLLAILRGEYRFDIAEGSSVTASYSGYQSYHRTHREALQLYDVSSHTIGARGERRKGNWLAALSLTGNASLLGPLTNAQTWRGVTPKLRGYARSVEISPQALYAISKSQAVGLDYSFRYERFVDSVERSHGTHGLALSYRQRMGDIALLAPSAGGFWNQAPGTANIWDYRGGIVALSGTFSLPGSFSLVPQASATIRSYTTDYAVEDARGKFSNEHRNDQEFNGGATVKWEWKSFWASGGLFAQRNRSTLEAYDFSRVISTFGIGAEL